MFRQCEWHKKYEKERCDFSTKWPASLKNHHYTQHEREYTAKHEAFDQQIADKLERPLPVPATEPEFGWLRHSYPKSSVHIVLVPKLSIQSPVLISQVFRDQEYLKRVREEAERLQKLVASELRRKYTNLSAQDSVRNKILDGDLPYPDDGELPMGRDWTKEVIVGTQASNGPTPLRIHILAKDIGSRWIQHKKHYNSFATPFFIPLAEFPVISLETYNRQTHLSSSPKCWRCGADFGDQIGELRRHLEEESEAWQKE